jgi:uridine phosphorylase
MIQNSELILNPDGSVYHVNLKPTQIAHDIIFVGDQNRVEKITKHFDSIEFSMQKREFKTQTGSYKETRTVKKELTSFNIVRIGTSGSLQADIPCDSFVMSLYGLGLDNMLRSYLVDEISEKEMEEAFINQTNWDMRKGRPYVISGSKKLEKQFESDTIFKGFTGTAGGFYGPQGRVIRLGIQDSELNSKMDSFSFKGIKMTNLEMETAAIYGLGKLLGHDCLSLNAIIANRSTGTFSEDPYKAVDELIVYVLDKLAAN